MLQYAAPSCATAYAMLRAAVYVIYANSKCMNNKYRNRVLVPYVQMLFQGSTCCGVVEFAGMEYSGLQHGGSRETATCEGQQLLALSRTPNCLSRSVLPQQDALLVMHSRVWREELPLTLPIAGVGGRSGRRHLSQDNKVP